jgi:hypothetical protein
MTAGAPPHRFAVDRDPPDRDTEGPLVGRRGELARLTERWRRAADGKGGGAVIRGPAGIGKSRLAAELAHLVEAAGTPVLRGQSTADDPVPLAPLCNAVESHLMAVARLPDPQRGLAQQRIRSAAGPAGALLAGLSPTLTALLDDAAGSDTVGQDQFAAAVAGFLTGLACACGGLLLVLDDLQWLDQATRRVLAQLGGELHDVPLLVLTSTRDDERGIEVDLDLTLGPLDAADIAELITRQLPGIELGPPLQLLADQLRMRGNGNPFVVLEYLRAIMDAGVLRPSRDGWRLDDSQLTGLDLLNLPPDVTGLVLARVDGLGARVRDVLVTAAAIGARFRPEVVAKVRRMALDDVLVALVSAAEHRLVEPREGGEYAFRHEQIRAAMLEQLEETETVRLHREIADVLAAESEPGAGVDEQHTYAVAQHYLRAGAESSPERAFAACAAAGRLALAGHAARDAVTFLEHAYELDQPLDGEFLALLGAAHIQNGTYGQATTRLEEALILTRDRFRRAEIHILLADVHRSSWDTGAATAVVEHGLAELGAALPQRPLGRVVSTGLLFARALLIRGSGIGFGSARGEERTRIGLIAALHRVGSYINVVAMRTDLIVMHNVRGVYWANRLGSGRQYALSQGTYGFVLGILGLLRPAMRAFRRAEADPAAQGLADQALLGHYRGSSLYLGRHDDGQAWLQVLEERGRWLDLTGYSDAVSVFHLEALTQGQTSEAELWLARGQRRLALSGGQITALTPSVAMTHAAFGRAGEASAALARLHLELAGAKSRGLIMLKLLGTTYVLLEQGELGASFDRAADEFEALQLAPELMIRSQQVIFFTLAMGRLAQCRAASPDELPARLAQARAAVAVLGKARNTALFRARERVARADLNLLEGLPLTTLKVLDSLDPFLTPDAPLLAYEEARIRARALSALGGEGEAQRRARLAHAIATRLGWPHRARWIISEFGDDADGRPAPEFTPRMLAPDDLARITLDEIIRILSPDRAFLFLMDGDRLVPHLGRDAENNDVGQLTGYSASLVDRVRETREPLVVTGTEKDVTLGGQPGLRSIMVAPLKLDDRLLGVIYLDSRIAKGVFTAPDLATLTPLTSRIANSLELARVNDRAGLFAKVQELGIVDEPTGDREPAAIPPARPAPGGDGETP